MTEDEKREKRNEYNRTWYARNREKACALSRKWKSEHPERHCELNKKWANLHKEQVSVMHKRYYDEHKEEILERVKIYHNEHPEVSREAIKRYQKRYPEKFAAQQIAMKEIPLSSICERCGSTAEHRHHPDYGHPLEVVFLCRKCHNAIHREQRRVQIGD